MKTKQLFFCSLTGLALLTTSCSSNDEALNGGNGASNDGNTYAQIAISVANSATTRADGNNTGDEVFGEDNEYTVKDLTVVLADKNDIAMQVITPELKTATNTDDADKQVRVTEPFTCTPGKYKVYVLANYKNSQSSLSPIIKGSTDMKMVFGIGDITKLYTENNFFMTNVSAPEEKDIVEKATGKEVNDDGTEKTGGKNVNLVTVNVERAVSKVTFGNTADKLSFNIEEGGNIIATAKLEGVSLINLNNKMYLVKHGELATYKPVADAVDWPYPEDPNYYKTKEDADYATYITDNFTQKEASSFSAPSDAKFYCPENTMSALAQLNGQTTGVVYKVNYKPEGKYYTELAAENGTDSYSQMFEKVLALGDDVRDAAITKTIFTDADKTDGTFYSYNGYVFKSMAGARLYKAIATANPSADAAAVNTAFTNGNEDGIQTYTKGDCYYTAWIKHNPGGTTMQRDKYGVVRNFWYELTVNSIKKLGYSKPTYKDPKDPDDKAEASIQVQVNIKKWRWVKQNVDLE